VTKVGRKETLEMKTPLLVAALALCAAAASAGPPESVDPAAIPAYRLLHPGLAAAGQPTPAALAGLREMGFRTVVNLRADKEVPPDERAVVEAQGLRYVAIPVTTDTFSLADVEALEKVLNDPTAAPVLLHCASSNRVGAAWAVIQARKGKSLEEAEAAGREAGLHSPPMAAAVRRVLGVPAPATAPPALATAPAAPVNP
jgi:uncharacterized protein (TIGR01244 family)